MDGKVPPTFDQELTNTTAELGSDVFMYSIATNADKVNWLFNGVPLEPDNKRIFSMGTSSLQIRNFSLSDQGLYTCVISNKYGRASSQAALEVEEPYEPTFTVDDPFDPSNDATLNRGKNLCKTTGLDKPLDPPRVNAMSDSSVLMRWTIPPEEQLPCLPLQFRIQYKRVPSVRSDSAESKQSVPPSARSYVVNDTQRSATSPARGDPAEWVTLDQGLPPTARSFVVNDLQPNHTYRFRYTILLRDLQPIQSRLSSRLTLGANPRVLPPRSPPELMTVVSKWPDAVQVKWEPPHEGAVPIDGYILQYRQVYGGVPVPYQNETIFGEEAREHMLDHLLPATPYEVRLVAFNSGGSSSPSDSMIASTLTLDGMQATINFFPETEDTSEGRLSSPNAPPSSQTTAYSIYTTAGAIFGVIVLCNIVIVTAYVIYRWRNGKRRQRRSSTSRNFNDTSYRLFRESAQRTRWQRQQQPMDDDLTLEPVAVNHCGPAAMRAARLGAFSTGCLKTVEHEPLVSILSQGGRFSPPNRGTL
uniref:Fibronectin type-III domain-containing protein n=1 Tax=Trichuris muris TaxID=70415 RepID=A0A5S6QE41_TRIMR